MKNQILKLIIFYFTSFIVENIIFFGYNNCVTFLDRLLNKSEDPITPTIQGKPISATYGHHKR